MKSLQVSTTEIDDINAAVCELSMKVRQNIELCSNSCGIVYCDYEVDVAKMSGMLSEALGFPIAGCTGMGLLTTDVGYADEIITLMVLTADDCEFAIGMTEEMNNKADVARAVECYNRLSSELSERVKLVFMYMPVFDGIIADDIVCAIDEACGKVPIVGGCASDNWKFTDGTVFYNGTASRNCMVFILVSGNIKPITRVEQSITNKISLHGIITSAEDDKINSVGNVPFTDVLDKIGIRPEKENVRCDYLGTPFLIQKKTFDGDEVEMLETLTMVDFEDKSGTFLGRIEPGSELSMVLLDSNAIGETVKKTFDEVLYEMYDSTDYNYSTILVVSCVARYGMIISDKGKEARGYLGRVPEGVSIQGFYSYGEICPAKGIHTGAHYNSAHHETFTLVAF